MVRKLLIAVLLAVCCDAVAEEQRCTELGSVCVCSEPLDVNQSIPAQTFVDPSDSTYKQCPGQPDDGRSFYSNSGGEAIPAYGFPPGAITDYVWRIPGSGVANLTGSSVSPTSRRLCVRLYHRFSASFDTPHTGTCERVKLAQISGDNFLAQFTLVDSGFFGNWVVKDAAGNVIHQTSLSQTNPSMNIENCKSDWCRVELCVSGDLQSTSTSEFSVEARATAVNSGISTYLYDPFGPVSGADSRIVQDNLWIGNLFIQGDCHGYRDISHGMQAEWGTDEGQWIGPAYEIEGGQPARKHLRGGGFSGGVLK